MRYFKKIDIENLQLIQQKSLEFIKTQPFIFYRQSKVTSLYDMNVLEFFQAVPELIGELKKLEISCVRVAAHVMYSNEHTIAHRDVLFPLARINIPVLNCLGSRTVFFENAQTFRWVNPASGVESHTVINDPKIAAEVEIDQATILRVSEAHNIIINEQTVPRICLTVGFREIGKVLTLLDS